MSAVLEINDETAELLAQRAKAQGLSVDDYLKSLLSLNDTLIAPPQTTENQAANLRARLQTFAEDWERPEMGAYDAL